MAGQRKSSQTQNRKQIELSPQSKREQSGGTYQSLWNATSPNNIQSLSAYTVNRLETTPMFNPLSYNTAVATPTSGLIPTGVHLGNRPAVSSYFCQTPPLWMQNGGGELESDTNEWIKHVKHYAISHGISYGAALRSEKCRDEYYQSKSESDQV